MDEDTLEQMEAMIDLNRITDIKMGKKTTVVCYQLVSGFEVVASSSCLDAEAYDHELGKKLCREKILKQICEFEGYYYLQNKLNDHPA